MADLLDVIALPSGETGTVVEVFPDGVLVEIADGDGRTIDLVVLRG